MPSIQVSLTPFVVEGYFCSLMERSPSREAGLKASGICNNLDPIQVFVRTEKRLYFYLKFIL